MPSPLALVLVYWPLLLSSMGLIALAYWLARRTNIATTILVTFLALALLSPRLRHVQELWYAYAGAAALRIYPDCGLGTVVFAMKAALTLPWTFEDGIESDALYEPHCD